MTPIPQQNFHLSLGCRVLPAGSSTRPPGGQRGAPKRVKSAPHGEDEERRWRNLVEQLKTEELRTDQSLSGRPHLELSFRPAPSLSLSFPPPPSSPSLLSPPSSSLLHPPPSLLSSSLLPPPSSSLSSLSVRALCAAAGDFPPCWNLFFSSCCWRTTERRADLVGCWLILSGRRRSGAVFPVWACSSPEKVVSRLHPLPLELPRSRRRREIPHMPADL